MELLARYLDVVRDNLPSASAEDIVAELSDTIQSRLEEKQAELGRPLTVDDEAGVLRTFGHPTVAASRFWKQQALIGPPLLPFYWQTLRIVLPVVVAVTAGVAFVLGVAKTDALAAFADFWSAIWVSLFVVFGIVTLIFALVERFHPAGDIVKWDPKSLPPVYGMRVPRSSSMADFIANALFAIALADTDATRSLLSHTGLGPAIVYIAGLPIDIPWWRPLVLTFLASSSLLALASFATYFRPEWFRLRAGAYVLTSAAMLIAFGVIAFGGAVVTIAPGSSPVEDVAKLVAVLHDVALWGSAAACIVSIGVIAVYGRVFVVSGKHEKLNLGAA